MTRFFEHGEPIRVKARDELPLAFIWRQGRHNVEIISNRWRVDHGWWKGERAWRDFFEVATHSGMLVVIFHDLEVGEWYLQRVYD